MKDFLTLEDKIEYYHRLLWRQNYIQVLKQGLNPICFDELLSYILKVNREATRQLMFKIVNDNQNRNKYLLKHTNFKFPEFWPDDPEYDYKFRLNYWLRTSTVIIQLFEDKKGRKKIKVDQDITLENTLIEGLSVDKVKNLCTRPNRSNYVGLFLYTINEKGYFKRKLAAKELEIIGNEFKPGFKWNKNYNKEPEYSKFPDLIIPDPHSLI
jgi:hypothetical protein